MPDNNDDLGVTNNEATKAYEQDISNRTGIPEELVEEGVKQVADAEGIDETEAAAEIDAELREAENENILEDGGDDDDNDDFSGND